MDSAPQMLRWAIPGWLLIIFFLIFVMIRSTFDGSILTWSNVDMLQELGLMAGSASVVGIPIGYLVYQLYWWMHWANPPGHIVRRDAGYEILKDADIDFDVILGIPLEDTSKQTKILRFRWLPFLGLRYLKEKPPDITERYQRNWYLAEYAWYDTLTKNDIEFLEQRAISLDDTYHSLGAARTSLIFAFWGYVLYDFTMTVSLVTNGRWLEYARLYMVPMLFNFIIACIIFFMLSHVREDTMEALIALKRNVITSRHRLARIERKQSKGP